MDNALFRIALDGLLPITCIGCGTRCGPDLGCLCHACRAEVSPAPPVPPPPGVDSWAAAFSYDGHVRELIARMKYRHGRAAVGWLADAIARVCPPSAQIDLVTWAPASVQRRRDQGVDHGQLLARGVARRIDRPVGASLARAPGRAQTGSSGLQRRQGPVLRAIAPVNKKRILLVDDVATTGATLARAACVLRRAGAVSVAAATAARTPARRRA